MNKLLSRVLAVALLGSVTVSTVSAYDKPVWRGTVENNTTMIPNGGQLVGADVNLTLTLGADMNPGTHFDVHFVNGGLPNTGKFMICNGDEQVGKYLTGNTGSDAAMVPDPTFEFTTDADSDLLKGGEILNFIDGGDDQNCSSQDTITVLATDCVTIYSDNGENTSGTVKVPEIDSAVPGPVIVTYRPDIEISCATPVCIVDSAGKAFTDGTVAMGVNKRVPTAVNADTNVSGDWDCNEPSGCGSVAGPGSCTVIIAIKNNTDYNITGMTLATTFAPMDGTSTLSDMNYTFIDDNVSNTDPVAAVGSDLVIEDLNITNDGNKTELMFAFIPSGTATIPQGVVNAEIKDIKDSADSPELADVKLPTKGLANFGGGAETTFTVTYMNRNYKSFAMITAYADTPLTATITDYKGNVTEADCGTISKNNTAFIFSDKKEHSSSCLVQAADAAGLADAWTVTFHVKAAVDVAAYMETPTGQRTLTVLYPQYATPLN
jgi:hypothetical protein